MPNEGALKSQVNRSISHYGAQAYAKRHIMLLTNASSPHANGALTLLAYANMRAHRSLLPMSTLHLIKLVQMQPKSGFNSFYFDFINNHKDSITLVIKKYVEIFDTFVVQL